MEEKKEFVSIDWLVKILLSIVTFFLVGIFITVQKTAVDVVKLNEVTKSIQAKYTDLDNRVKYLEHERAER